MARVNVDSQALADARFAVLADLMGADDPDFALGKMVRLWMQCIERETYVVTHPVIVALFRGAVDAPDWLVSAELAEPVKGGFRIKGTRGRIEYLSEKRANGKHYGHLGAEHGKKGGRPRKTPIPGFEKPPRGGVHNPPPAPAPAPALKDKDKNPLPPELDTPDFRASWSEWVADRKARKKELTPRAAELQLRQLAKFGPGWAIDRISAAIIGRWIGLVFKDDEPGKANNGTRQSGNGVRPASRVQCESGRYGNKPAIVAGVSVAAPAETDAANVAE